MQTKIQDSLAWLSGKKSIITGLVCVIAVYLAKEGEITDNIAFLVTSIMTLLAGGASYATQQYVYAGKLAAKKE